MSSCFPANDYAAIRRYDVVAKEVRATLLLFPDGDIVWSSDLVDGGGSYFGDKIDMRLFETKVSDVLSGNDVLVGDCYDQGDSLASYTEVAVSLNGRFVALRRYDGDSGSADCGALWDALYGAVIEMIPSGGRANRVPVPENALSPLTPPASQLSGYGR